MAVTAGPSYDPSSHDQVDVNGQDATYVESDFVSAWVRVRIKDYHGLPRNSPSTSPYFSHKQHTSDRYSVAYSFIPKHDIPGSDIVMGFDYSHSVRHQLPPGTKYAMKIATSLLDPGLYSDPYCDEPYLYGPALSSWFAFSIGDLVQDTPAKTQLFALDSNDSGVISEGATGPSGDSIRNRHEMPSKWKKRRKHFLDTKALSSFTFEKGRMYHADFFNPHLDFANFALRLPGFSISVAKYVDEKTHHLRYVLKNRKTGEVLFCVFFKLLFGKELEDTLQQNNEGREDESKKREVEVGGNSDEDTRTRIQVTENIQKKEVLPSPASLDGPTLPSKSDSESADIAREGSEKYKQEQGIVGSAASNLANSIYAVYAAMGFTNSSSSSSSQSEGESRGSSPPRSGEKLHAEIDKMDDTTVEQFLQSRHSHT